MRIRVGQREVIAAVIAELLIRAASWFANQVLGLTSLLEGKWGMSQSATDWAISTVGAIAVFTALVVYDNVRWHRQHAGDSIPADHSTGPRPIDGGIELGRPRYLGVDWPLSYDSDLLQIAQMLNTPPNPEQINIAVSPRCPRCGTGLVESRNWCGRFVWTCVRGDFKKRSRQSFAEAHRNVTLLIRREYEERKERHGGMRRP